MRLSTDLKKEKYKTSYAEILCKLASQINKVFKLNGKTRLRGFQTWGII